MPLERGKSRAAFEHNVRTEIEHGKPQKQAVAIAYAQQRRADAGKMNEILAHCDAFERKERTRLDSKFSELVSHLEHKGYSTRK